MTRLAVSALLVAALLPACRRRPITQDECDRLLDRYVEMQVRIDDPKPRAETLDRARAAAKALAVTNPAFRSCTRDVTRESMDCALVANDADQIERCLIPMP